MHCIVCPKIKAKLKTSQVVKKRKAIMESGIKILSLVCSLFFSTKNPPSAAKTKPISSG